MRLTLFTLLLTAAAAVAADPAVKLPAEVKAQPGRLVRLKAETAAKGLDWLLVSPADLCPDQPDRVADLIPFPGTAEALFSAPRPGRYVVLCWVAPGQSARCVVVVGDTPAPKPPPGPTPPSPDPLRVKLKSAYDADPGDGPTKDAARRDLVALYRQAVTLAGDPAVASVTALAARLKAAGQTLAAGELTGTRTAIAVEMAAAFPADGPLTPETRTRAAALFDRIAAALDW